MQLRADADVMANAGPSSAPIWGAEASFRPIHRPHPEPYFRRTGGVEVAGQRLFYPTSLDNIDQPIRKATSPPTTLPDM